MRAQLSPTRCSLGWGPCGLSRMERRYLMPRLRPFPYGGAHRAFFRRLRRITPPTAVGKGRNEPPVDDAPSQRECLRVRPLLVLCFIGCRPPRSVCQLVMTGVRANSQYTTLGPAGAALCCVSPYHCRDVVTVFRSSDNELPGLQHHSIGIMVAVVLLHRCVRVHTAHSHCRWLW